MNKDIVFCGAVEGVLWQSPYFYMSVDEPCYRVLVVMIKQNVGYGEIFAG